MSTYELRNRSPDRTTVWIRAKRENGAREQEYRDSLFIHRRLNSHAFNLSITFVKYKKAVPPLLGDSGAPDSGGAHRIFRVEFNGFRAWATRKSRFQRSK